MTGTHAYMENSSHTYGLQRVGLAALINIRFLKYLPTVQSDPAASPSPPRATRPTSMSSSPHPTPDRESRAILAPHTAAALSTFPSKARYSICIFKLESLYMYTRTNAPGYSCSLCLPPPSPSPSPLPPPAASLTTAARFFTFSPWRIHSVSVVHSYFACALPFTFGSSFLLFLFRTSLSTCTHTHTHMACMRELVDIPPSAIPYT